MAACESIVKQTGWNVSILVGGPMPREGGKIKTYMCVNFCLRHETSQTYLIIRTHFGRTKEGQDFMEYLGGSEYEEHIVSPFDDFLHDAFSKL